MDKQALSAITERPPPSRGKGTVPGPPCPTCGVSRFYASKTTARKCQGKDCQACANSKKSGGVGVAFDALGNKLCSDCRTSPQKHNTLCQGCGSKRLMQNYFQKYRYTKYGVTKEWFDAKFSGSCEICASAITRESVHIDHDHVTNKARGLLCGLCNKGLGQFKDSVENLQAAAAYLKKSKA